MPAQARQLKDGLRWRYTGSFKGQKYISPARYNTREEAEDAERLYVAHLSGEDKRLKFYTAKRLDELRLTKSRDYGKETRRYFRMMEDTWGDIPVGQISRSMINDLLNQYARLLKQNGKTLHKVNAMLRVIKAFFNWLIVYQDIEMRNPVVGLKLYPIEHTDKYIPSAFEIDLVRQHLNTRQCLLFDFVLETGCRVMEAVRLRREDVTKTQVTLKTRKAKNSNLTPRKVPRPPCLTSDLLPKAGQVFPEWGAYPHFLMETVKRLPQIKEKWNWHSLRHRYASLLAKEGRTLLEIMYLLGHNNLSTTQRYLQLLGFRRL